MGQDAFEQCVLFVKTIRHGHPEVTMISLDPANPHGLQARKHVPTGRFG